MVGLLRPDLRAPALMRMAPRLAEFAMVAWLAWIVSGWLLPQPAVAPAGGPDAGEEASLAWDIEAMMATPLFGKAEKAGPVPKPKAPPPRPAPARLDAKLLGTVVAGEHSAAILKLAKEREQRVFFLGDAIMPGIVLDEVLPDAVLVRRDGRRERIELEKGAALPGATTPAPPAAARPSPPERRVVRPFSRRRIERGIRDFPKLLSQARVVPHFVDGKADGFVITDIVPGSLYAQAGLQNGDVIRKVNGQQVTSAQQAMAMYQALEKASAIDLEIERAGQMLQLHYDIR
ncbi:MAG: type II secretion system protein N [Mariprofundaceae bacterium]